MLLGMLHQEVKIESEEMVEIELKTYFPIAVRPTLCLSLCIVVITVHDDEMCLCNESQEPYEFYKMNTPIFSGSGTHVAEL